MNDKVTLADNRAKGQSAFENIFQCTLIALAYGGGSWLAISMSDFLPMLIFPLVIFGLGLFYLEAFLVNNFAHEVVSIEYETLIIRREGCIFRHHKEIPLSTIRKVEYDEGTELWYPRWIAFPEHIRVYYGDSRLQSTRFGLCMPDGESGVLRNRIMKYASKYK